MMIFESKQGPRNVHTYRQQAVGHTRLAPRR